MVRGGVAIIASWVRVARDSLTGSRTLYRAVSLAEYDDLKQMGRLGTGGHPEAMEFAKWFAERYGDAVCWGYELGRLGGRPPGAFRIVKASWPRAQVESFHFIRDLDQIGPARAAPSEAWPDARIDLTLYWWDRA
jgi:hypothetical protein